MNPFIRKIGRLKLYLQRSRDYVVVLTFATSLFAAMGKAKDFGVTINLAIWFVPIFVAMMLFLTLLGWLDVKLKLLEEERRVIGLNHPVMLETNHIVKRLEKRIMGDNPK